MLILEKLPQHCCSVAVHDLLVHRVDRDTIFEHIPPLGEEVNRWIEIEGGQQATRLCCEQHKKTILHREIHCMHGKTRTSCIARTETMLCSFKNTKVSMSSVVHS